MILRLHPWKKSKASHATVAQDAGRHDGRLEHISTGSSLVTMPKDPAVELTFAILDKIAEGVPLRSVNIRLWNGDYWRDSSPKPATLVLNRPSALREMLSGCSEVALGEAYLNEAFDVEGDLEAAFEWADLLAVRTHGWSTTLTVAGMLHRLPNRKGGPARRRRAELNGKRNSPDRDRGAIRFHYDVSNEFYQLWLDPRMVYSCAYFENPESDLEQAQRRKLDWLCRKLELEPGERLLEIGSGWGGLLLHAATHYGVKADGITLSRNQLEWTQDLIEKQGLQDRVTVRLVDYRELEEAESYDKAVSVGMVEHVGRQNLGLYFQQVSRLLKPGGLFLNHGIGLGPVPIPNSGAGFIENYVFPDTDLVSIGHMLNAAESARWEVRDVESLREHYAITLRHWVRRLEGRRADALKEVDEAAYRIWRLYMAGSAHGFKLGQLSVYQTVLAKIDSGGKSRAPLNRECWYQREK
jgi:cyclopropane-fatty-acyl-phospholipid synthase